MASKPQAPEDIHQKPEGSLLDSKRCGLPLKAVLKLGEQLVSFWRGTGFASRPGPEMGAATHITT